MNGSLVGQRFGQLTVLRRGENSRAGDRRWVCQCDCGGSALSTTTHLRNGHTRSCGCLGVKNLRNTPTHGGRGHALYNTWASMVQRCTNARRLDFPRYGGHGIRVCERWQDFAAFLADMGEKPSPQHSLDRIDNDGNYEPGNCRWATAKEQRANQRQRKAS